VVGAGIRITIIINPFWSFHYRQGLLLEGRLWEKERAVVAWTAVVVLNRCSSCHRRYRAGWLHGRRAWNRLAARRNNRPDRCFTVLPPPALPRHGALVRPAGHRRLWRLWLIVMTSKIVTRNGRRWRIRLGLPTYILHYRDRI